MRFGGGKILTIPTAQNTLESTARSQSQMRKFGVWANLPLTVAKFHIAICYLPCYNTI